jgi:hypothetical protein
MVATTRSLAGSMRTSELVSPRPAHTAPFEVATALGRSQLRMRKSPCGVWWTLRLTQPARPCGLPTTILPTGRFVRRSTLDTVPSPEFAIQAKPSPTATPAGFTPVLIVTVLPCTGDGGADTGALELQPAAARTVVAVMTVRAAATRRGEPAGRKAKDKDAVS